MRMNIDELMILVENGVICVLVMVHVKTGCPLP